MKHALVALVSLALAASCRSAPPGREACAAPSGAALPRPLTQDEVVCGLKAHREELLRCRDVAAPEQRGMATIDLVLLPTGRTSSVSVRPPELAASPLGPCLVEQVRAWTFPAFDGPPIPVDFEFPVRRAAR